jgi:hypothetical protein
MKQPASRKPGMKPAVNHKALEISDLEARLQRLEAANGARR